MIVKGRLSYYCMPRAGKEERSVFAFVLVYQIVVRAAYIIASALCAVFYLLAVKQCGNRKKKYKRKNRRNRGISEGGGDVLIELGLIFMYNQTYRQTGKGANINWKD
ncbi:MAG: hypothetical protein SOR92_05575 [Christensenella hongkongensis]|uniref:hypothetical protein n=1 Tax=Christensenella hongkongensis TaxID=270498 RepID=UPI002A75FC57|nr:hypothetical protein [Christensenella hongkongensis]MDY3003918.1 hypothetical protein [Christensenella hongkongensis]